MPVQHELSFAVMFPSGCVIINKWWPDCSSGVHILTSPKSVAERLACMCLQGGQRTVLVTELMERGDLYTLIGRYQGRFAWNKLGRYVALDVARGLAFLHARNIVHFECVILIPASPLLNHPPPPVYPVCIACASAFDQHSSL